MSSDLSERIERLARLVHNEAHAESLKPVHWEVLRYLARANSVSRSPKGVTAFLGLTKGTVSQTLMALERKRLLSRQERAGDARGLCLNLTTDGVDALSRDPLNALDDALGALGKRDCDALSQGLERLLDQMIKRRGGTPFGVCHTCRHFQSGQPDFCDLLKLAIDKDDTDRICMEHEAAGAAV